MTNNQSNISHDMDSPVCPHCITPVGQFDHFCPKCRGPITVHASMDPMGQVYSEGHAFGNAISGRPRFIVVLGMWGILGAQIPFLIFFLYLISLEIITPGQINNFGEVSKEPQFLQSIKFILIFALVALYSTILWKVTRRYYIFSTNTVQEEKIETDFTEGEAEENGILEEVEFTPFPTKKIIKFVGIVLFVISIYIGTVLYVDSNYLIDNDREIMKQLETEYGLSIPKIKHGVPANLFGCVIYNGQVTELHLSDKGITDITLICGLSGLQILDLTFNQLTMLPPETGQLAALEWLYLQQNQLKALPETMNQLVNLEIIQLDDNLLEEVNSLKGMTHLSTITLDNNPLQKNVQMAYDKGNNSFLRYLQVQ